MDTLYDDAGLYDLVAPPDAAMAAFYTRVAGGAGRRCLELACGTGRLTGPVAASGASVTGLDLSATMLDAARARVPGARFVAADMRMFDLGERFDTVFIAANSLLHLSTEADFAGFFAAVARHLLPGGRLAFDIFVPSIALLSRAPDTRHPLGAFEHGELGTVVIEEATRYDPVSQVMHADWFWSAPGLGMFRRTKLSMRQIYPAELLSLLAANGFALESRHGDFDGAPFDASSWRQVCVAVPVGRGGP